MHPSSSAYEPKFIGCFMRVRMPMNPNAYFNGDKQLTKATCLLELLIRIYILRRYADIRRRIFVSEFPIDFIQFRLKPGFRFPV